MNIYPDGQILKEEALEIKKKKKTFENDEFLTFTASKENACENGKYCIALEKKEQIVKLMKYWEEQQMHGWEDSGSSQKIMM